MPSLWQQASSYLPGFRSRATSPPPPRRNGGPLIDNWPLKPPPAPSTATGMGGLYDRFPEIVTKTMSRLDSRSPFATDQWDEFRPPPMDVIDVDIKARLLFVEATNRDFRAPIDPSFRSHIFAVVEAYKLLRLCNKDLQSHRVALEKSFGDHKTMTRSQFEARQLELQLAKDEVDEVKSQLREVNTQLGQTKSKLSETTDLLRLTQNELQEAREILSDEGDSETITVMYDDRRDVTTFPDQPDPATPIDGVSHGSQRSQLGKRHGQSYINGKSLAQGGLATLPVFLSPHSDRLIQGSPAYRSDDEPCRSLLVMEARIGSFNPSASQATTALTPVHTMQNSLTQPRDLHRVGGSQTQSNPSPSMRSFQRIQSSQSELPESRVQRTKSKECVSISPETDRLQLNRVDTESLSSTVRRIVPCRPGLSKASNSSASTNNNVAFDVHNPHDGINNLVSGSLPSGAATEHASFGSQARRSKSLPAGGGRRSVVGFLRADSAEDHEKILPLAKLMSDRLDMPLKEAVAAVFKLFSESSSSGSSSRMSLEDDSQQHGSPLTPGSAHSSNDDLCSSMKENEAPFAIHED